MQPYEFKPSSGVLVLQPDGKWVAEFEAAIYTGQSFDEISNTLDPDNIRIIEIDVTGAENNPVDYHEGSSAPYTRGTETEVKLVLMRNGKRKGSITVSYY